MENKFKKQVTDKDKVSWNLSENLIQEIADHLRLASHHYVKYDYEKALQHLEAVRMRIVDRLDEDEIKKFEALENNLYMIALKKKKKHGCDFNPLTIEQMKAAFDYKKGYNKYNTYLFKIMRAYNYTIVEKKDNTVLNI